MCVFCLHVFRFQNLISSRRRLMLQPVSKARQSGKGPLNFLERLQVSSATNLLMRTTIPYTSHSIDNFSNVGFWPSINCVIFWPRALSGLRNYFLVSCCCHRRHCCHFLNFQLLKLDFCCHHLFLGISKLFFILFSSNVFYSSQQSSTSRLFLLAVKVRMSCIMFLLYLSNRFDTKLVKFRDIVENKLFQNWLKH